MTRQVSVLAGITVLSLAGTALAAAPQGSEGNGEALLRAVESGSKNCSDLSATDFEAMGEYTMGQMMGSARGHEAMDRFMSSMMGPESARKVHEAMGRRFAGCGGASFPRGFGRMMGAIGAVGMMGGGMMGPYRGEGFGSEGQGYGPGYMMGGYRAARENDNGDGPSAAAMIGMMAVVIGAVALALVLFRPRRNTSTPLKRLQQRFARGELTADEYQEQKRLLEGG
jgi:Short C-terminal domain